MKIALSATGNNLDSAIDPLLFRSDMSQEK